MLRLFLILLLCAASATANDELVVQVQCGDASGSGVIVSTDGHVLTAAHVVKDRDCIGRIGASTAKPTALLDPKFDATFDAAIIRLAGDHRFDAFATVCPLAPEMKERRIVTAGFNSKIEGPPARKDGVISTVTLQDHSTQISAPIVLGESGGPVFLEGSTSIVGIVQGADFDVNGAPTGRMTPAGQVLDLGLTLSKDCAPRPDSQTIYQQICTVLVSGSDNANVDLTCNFPEETFPNVAPLNLSLSTTGLSIGATSFDLKLSNTSPDVIALLVPTFLSLQDDRGIPYEINCLASATNCSRKIFIPPAGETRLTIHLVEPVTATSSSMSFLLRNLTYVSASDASEYPLGFIMWSAPIDRGD